MPDLFSLRNAFYWFLVLAIPMVSCKKMQETTSEPEFQNVLDLSVIPQDPYDLDGFGFSDLGAWHGFAQPPPDSTKYAGGFSGPLLMKTYGRWMAKSLCRLEIMDKNQRIIPFEPSKSRIYSLPGRLVQELETDKLRIKLILIFVDERTSLQSTEIQNISKEDQSIFLSWNGELFERNIDFQTSTHGFSLQLPDSSLLETAFSIPLKSVVLKDSILDVLAEKTELKKGENMRIEFAIRYAFHNDDEKNLNTLYDLLQKTELLDQQNQKRWNNYITKVCAKNMTQEEKHLSVKCLQTLMTNWRSPAGGLQHHGIFPSAAYQGFYGFWSWDSWKHSVAVVQFDPFLAKEGIRSMFDYQNKAGMVADCIYFDSTENNWRDTKAPLAAWSVYEVFKATKDTAFVREMLPKLIQYHQWWYSDRDHDQNGLCEYGSTDGTLIAAKWESGMDNAVRFDETKILKNSETAWSFDQESVDLNAYLQKEKEYLSKLCSINRKNEMAEKFHDDAKELADRICAYFWHPEKQWFFDRKLNHGDFLDDFGPEGWTPLWTAIASEQQAASLVKIMCDTSRFNTKVPLPTLDAGHTKFNPLKGYWRGPVWLDQAYFGIKALRNYGYEEEADQLTQKIFQNAEGLLENAPIRENYHPISGKGLNANHFSWSAAHLMMMMEKE